MRTRSGKPVDQERAHDVDGGVDPQELPVVELEAEHDETGKDGDREQRRKPGREWDVRSDVHA